ncbi:hypothetical protein PR202_gb27231 [Eleusine coracana subsp. coracana]|uniref:U-box domain-containing protein n=1 Tax=Eleusine coracana subsp. coracana TaxID=191504 RepID=A0AAV5FTQ0_ELECO|nr:hypothetical protein PR202_gb27231 [Eleusine coracana subsp. coracana]
MAGPPPSYSAIVSHTSSFLAELIADPLLRRHLLSAAAAATTDVQNHPAATLQALSLVSDALDAAAASASPSPSSLRAAERLLRSSVTPSPTPLSCLLLALACAARRRGAAAAAAAVMDLFALDPALARHEVAPAAFEALFAPRMLPVMRHFAARRAAAAAEASRSGGGDEDRSVETAAMRVLSTMSGAQAQEMRELEREYDKVLDVNCRAYALYLKNIIDAGDASTTVSSPPPPPPELVFGVGDGEEKEDAMAPETEEETVSSRNDARYNVIMRHYTLRSVQTIMLPMWAEEHGGDLYPRGLQGSTSFKGRRDLRRPPSLYPQRVAPHLILQQQQSPPTSRGSPASSRLRESSPAAPSDDSLSMDGSSSSELCGGGKEENGAHGDDGHLSPEPASSSSPMAAAVEETPVLVSTPKDFVCPITSQVFEDPVTLETGQTYERRAIQEWLHRGNATCPITRQRLLHAGQLPNTNYVLKRLIAAWRESPPLSSPSSRRQSPPPVSATITMETNNKLRSPDAASAPSPTSVIALASVEAAAAELRAAVSCLCTSDDLAASEAAVLNIHRLWRDSDPAFLAATLARPAVVNGFVEILFNSVTAQVLQTCVFLLAELASRDGAVVQTLTRVDSDVDCLVALFNKGLMEAVSLIYLLSPTPEQLADMDMADALVAAVRRHGDEDDGTGTVVKMCVDPKAASVMLLSQLVLFETTGDTDDSSSSSAAAPVVPRAALLSERFVRGVVASLDADTVEEKLAAMRILLRCVAEDGHCRTTIVDKASSLGALLDAFHAVGDADKFDIVRFLHEILKLKK